MLSIALIIMLSVIMLNVIMLSDIMLSIALIIMLSVVAPLKLVKRTEFWAFSVVSRDL